MDKGLGDTVARVISSTGLEFLSKLYEKKTGKDCGCNARKAALNKVVPYNNK
tara:strand:- start:25 stop:180 length:156 start_codon:yes stop_codon:yes gene_type:complete